MKQIKDLKVGDKLYGFCYPKTSITVVQEEYVEDIDLEAGVIETDDGFYSEEDFGEIIFMTREDAEAGAIKLERKCREEEKELEEKIMKEVITAPQQSDMGDGHGYIANVEGCTLKQVLDYLNKNSNSWGTVTIRDGKRIVRLFDYNTWSGNNIFYHHLRGWEYKLTVKRVSFIECFMQRDIFITLED